MKAGAPLKEGFLLFPPHGILSQLKKWQKKYCLLFSASNQGVDRLEVYDSEDQAAKSSTAKIIALEECVKITEDPQKHQPHVFLINTKSQAYHLSAMTAVEMEEWISALQEVAFGKGVGEGDCEEENVLYYSTEGGVFSVEVVETEASERCGMQGTFTLVLGRNALILRSQGGEDDGRILCTWPYQHIRKYGHRGSRFQFEAGRQCQSGEGVFKFSHPKSQEIHHCLGETLRSIERMSTNTGEEVEATSLMFSQMEPSSDSLPEPLKPQKTGESVKKKPSKPPRKSMLKKSTSDSASSSQDDLAKPRPPLPNPRRSEIAPSHTYDSVEVRTEAWRTMGLDQVIHVEKEQQVIAPVRKLPLTLTTSSLISSVSDATVAPAPASVGGLPLLKTDAIKFVPPKAEGLKFVPLSANKPPQSEEGYDHLQHFGVQSPTTPVSPGPTFASQAAALSMSSTGDASAASSGHIYRRLNSNPAPQQPQQWKPTSDEYEYATFEEGGLSSCRPADDSHTGYATINKPVVGAAPVRDSLPDEALQHYKCNESEYAVVNKNGN